MLILKSINFLKIPKKAYLYLVVTCNLAHLQDGDTEVTFMLKY
jgi:hypothetical protein